MKTSCVGGMVAAFPFLDAGDPGCGNPTRGGDTEPNQVRSCGGEDAGAATEVGRVRCRKRCPRSTYGPVGKGEPPEVPLHGFRYPTRGRPVGGDPMGEVPRRRRGSRSWPGTGTVRRRCSRGAAARPHARECFSEGFRVGERSSRRSLARRCAKFSLVVLHERRGVARGSLADPALAPPDQRQGRTVPPHAGHRVGLRSPLLLRGRAPSRLSRLLGLVQPPSAPTGIGGRVPAARVTNLTEQHI
mgnify:CR=1 FL=1